MIPPLREPFHSMARAVFFWDLDLGYRERDVPSRKAAPLRRRRPVRSPVSASPIRHATNGMLPRERGMVLCFPCSPVKIIMPATVRPHRFLQSDDSLPLRNRAVCLSCPGSVSPKGRSSSPPAIVQYQPSFDQMRSIFQPHSERERASSARGLSATLQKRASASGNTTSEGRRFVNHRNKTGLHGPLLIMQEQM